MRSAAAVLLGVLACASAVRAAEVRLDRAALEALARENPAHYARVQQVLRARSVVGDERLPGCVGVSFDARELSVGKVLLTTDPPQHDLRFVLDDAVYIIRVRPRASAGFVTLEGEIEDEAPCPR